MLDRIEFLIAEAFSALRRNTWMTFAAVTTAAMALFFLGGMGFIYVGFSNFMTGLSKRVDMKVLIRDEVPDPVAKALQNRILKVSGVATVRYIPRDLGLKEFLKENPNIDIKGLDLENPLPNAYVVHVTDLKVFDDVASKLQTFKEVEPNGVIYPHAEQNFLADAMRTVRWLGFTLGGLMLVTSGILIYNAIRMTVMARRREIRIMQLVGATRFMVWAPMLIEGVVQGTVGGILASFVLWSAHNIVQATVVRNLSAFGKMAAFPYQQAFLLLGSAGAIYGLVCSLVAVREPLQLRRRHV